MADVLLNRALADVADGNWAPPIDAKVDIVFAPTSDKVRLVSLDDIWGPLELAARWGVTPQVVYTRKSRGTLPDPDLVISRVPLWLRSTIEVYESAW